MSLKISHDEFPPNVQAIKENGKKLSYFDYRSAFESGGVFVIHDVLVEERAVRVFSEADIEKERWRASRGQTVWHVPEAKLPLCLGAQVTVISEAPDQQNDSAAPETPHSTIAHSEFRGAGDAVSESHPQNRTLRGIVNSIMRVLQLNWR
jgi:hypothetical protein